MLDVFTPNYWPPVSDYTPGLTPKQWLALLNDPAVTTPETLTMLQAMQLLGGESTCAHLAEVYGRNYNYYNTLGYTFGRRIKLHTNCPAYPSAETKYWWIPFVGRNVQEDGKKRFSWKLRDELKEALLSIPIPDHFSVPPGSRKTDIPLNTILYGPPGTGKTYYTVIYAVAVIEQVPLDVIEAEAAVNYSEVLRRFREYRAAERIGFVTFHQSYGYEDFIEGIRPVVSGEDDADGGDLRYRVEPGIFKRFCSRAEVRSVSAPDIRHLGIREDPAIWKVSLEGSGENETRRECLSDAPNGHIRIGWDAYGPNITEETNFADGGKVVLNAFINRIQVGDIVLSCYNASTIDGIGVVTGDYEWHNEYKHYKRLRRVNWIVRKKLNVLELTGGSSLTTASVYRMWNVALPDLYRLIEENLPASSTPVAAAPENYAFIIDEINRGNISKIFGELITLLEPSKRIGAKEEMRISLPYSPKPFGIPENVWVLGTMNTADRSIALLDTALRRRFHFVEMMPQPELFAGILVDELDIQRMLTRLNQKISILYDREHTIGHACFMSLRDTPTLETLAGIFRSSILPLLQEYFYDDYEKIRLILGDNRKPDPAFQFVRKLPEDPDLFGDGGSDISLAPQYEINEGAFLQIDSYRSI